MKKKKHFINNSVVNLCRNDGLRFLKKKLPGFAEVQLRYMICLKNTVLKLQ